jgi:hypothetical protein
MNRLGLLITVMLALMAMYFLITTVYKPTQPQVVVVRPSGAQSGDQSGAQAQTPTPAPPPPPPADGVHACTKAIFLRVGTTSLCVDKLYSVVKTDNMIQVDFQGGIVQGFFMFASAPSCAITTTPQGTLLIPCRAQILISIK